MLEFYYSIPFSDKYNETLSAETKEKLFKNGQWTALEDSGFAILKTAVDEEQFSEDITIKVWNSGEVAAVTTRYDEGSDCPPINQLSLFRYNNGWRSS